jgi:hypothetical protein
MDKYVNPGGAWWDGSTLMNKSDKSLENNVNTLGKYFHQLGHSLVVEVLNGHTY